MYVLLRVDSPTEAARLVEDITENPAEALETPHWHNRVRVAAAAVLEQVPAELTALGGTT